jgi:hypothetical protein
VHAGCAAGALAGLCRQQHLTLRRATPTSQAEAKSRAQVEPLQNVVRDVDRLRREFGDSPWLNSQLGSIFEFLHGKYPSAGYRAQALDAMRSAVDQASSATRGEPAAEAEARFVLGSFCAQVGLLLRRGSCSEASKR